MKYKTMLAILLVAGALNLANSQIIDYQWQDQREPYNLSQEELSYPAIFLYNYTAYQYLWENKDKDKNLELYTLTHKIVKVNQDDAIEQFNKIYIPTENVIEILQLKARAISQDGKVTLLDEKNIKELQDESSEKGFKIFAIEGVELGSEIEYYFISKNYVNFFGRDYYQYSVPVKEGVFRLLSPDNLVFECKGYNDFPNPEEVLADGGRMLEARVNDVKPLKQEAFSFYNANRARVEFRLAHNTDLDKTPLLTWNDAARRIHKNIYSTEKQEKKALKKAIRKLKLHKIEEQGKIIAEVERYIKGNILLKEGYSGELYNLKKILQNQYGSKTGIVRLYAAFFKELDIACQVGMTTDRSEIKFDQEFHSWNYLVHYIIYFNDLNTYLSPERFEYRYNMIPYYHTNNHGLFIKKIDLGDYEGATGEIRFIPASDYNQNYDNLSIDISFAEDMEKTEIDLTRELGGYSGAFIQPVFAYLQEDKKRAIVEELVKMSAMDAKFKELEIVNGDIDIRPLDNPFTINASIESSSLIERAGNKFLFKFGSIIGPQAELYQEETRENDIENDFNRKYERQISFEIPDQYQVKNLEDIKMEAFFKDNEDKVFNFSSDYTLKDNVVTVHVKEYYKQINCSADHFEEFRQVINAAADFNKLTLIFERK